MPYDGTALSATDLQVANYTRLMYPNPFFDLSRHYFPKSVKTLFKYCRIFFYQNEFIHNVINKLSEYPITDFIYDGINDDVVRKNYKELAEHHLKLKSFLIECGLDYFTFGNCIVSANMKFKRFLVCGNCKQPSLFEDFPFRWANLKFIGEKCPKCGATGIELTIDDRYLKNPKYFKFIKWSPENITIDYDDLTGESRYFYMMNEKTRKGIVEGKKEVLQRVPKLFIEAIQKNRKIELDPRNIYHFKRPTLAEEDQGWGKPLLLPAMKMLWYMQTLRRGNEAIVADHLVPMRSIYPSSQGNLDPFCLSPNAWVYTAAGVKQLKNITERDQLITETGTKTDIVTIKEMTITHGWMCETDLYGMSAFKHVSTDMHPFRTFSNGSLVWKEASRLNTNDYLAYPIKPFSTRNNWIDTASFIPVLRKHKHVLPRKIRFTEKVARLFGLYLAKGCATERGKIEFCFNSAEHEYINHVKNTLDSWLPDSETTIVKKDGNYVQVLKCSVELGLFLGGLLGDKCINKTIKNLGNLTKKQTIALLKGLYEGDGTFFYERNRYPRLHLKSINFGLLAEVRDLLLSLKLYPSLVKDCSYTEGEKRGVCYQLKLQGYQAEKLADMFGWNSRKYYTTNDISTKFKFIEDMVLVKVEKVKKSKETKYIALEVADPSHSYLSVGAINHNTQLNLGQWTSQVQEQLLRWRIDPNNVGVFPVPIGMESIGGDAKLLMVTPELQYLEESIINSLGVPVEFIKGGSTWTSSSVSLRIVENHFLQYRESITEFLNYFVVPKVKYFLGYPDVHIRLKKFKMSDDIQAKELLLQLSAAGKIPDSYLLEEFGIDPAEARKLFKSDNKVQLDMQTAQLMAQAESQGKGMVIQARYQTRAQAEAIEEAARLNERKFAAELVQEMGITDMDPSDILQRQAIALQYMDPKRQQAVLKGLQAKAPTSFGFIVQRLQMNGVIPSPEEQRQQEMVQQEAEIAEQEHGHKMQESKQKMKETEHKVDMDKEKLKTDWEKVEIEKERSKIPPKKVAKK